MKRQTIGLALLALATLILAGCGSKRPVIGEEKIVETSSKKPKWVKAREDFTENDGIMYFRGMVQHVQDLTLSRRQAEADARKRITDAVVSFVRTEYEEYARGANLDPYDVNKFVADGVAWNSESTMLIGVLTGESYWEKVKTSTYDGMQCFYNCWAQSRISRSDYDRARMMAVTGLIQKARAANAKAAEDVAIGLQKKLEEGWAP